MPNKSKNFEELLSEILLFVKEQVPWRKKIDENYDLYNDLRMDPWDAENLLVKFFHAYNVSEGDFEWDRYFPPDGAIVANFLRFLLFRPRRKPVKLVRLTVGMLAGAARDGVWRTEVLEREFC